MVNRTIQIPTNDYARLRQLKEVEHLSIADLIRLAIKKFLDEYDEKHQLFLT